MQIQTTRQYARTHSLNPQSANQPHTLTPQSANQGSDCMLSISEWVLKASIPVSGTCIAVAEKAIVDCSYSNKDCASSVVTATAICGTALLMGIAGHLGRCGRPDTAQRITQELSEIRTLKSEQVNLIGQLQVDKPNEQSNKRHHTA